MMTKHYCKHCFRAMVDDCASDKSLLMTEESAKCPYCGSFEPLVCVFFKWGEQEVTADGKRVISAARHVGVNPNYSFWGNCYPYADVENYRG